MALFSRKKDLKNENKAEDAKSEKKAAVSTQKPTDRNISAVLLKPRITEKAVRAGERNVYTFVVHKDATKYDVRDAVIEHFGVTPVKVNIVNKAPRKYMARAKGRVVSEKGMKKAYVYLKQGDTISLV